MPKRVIFFYIFVLILMAVFTLLGLFYNIKTVYINEENQKLSAKINKLKEENKELQIFILENNRLEVIEKIAQEKLQLVPTNKIEYFTNKEPADE